VRHNRCERRVNVLRCLLKKTPAGARPAPAPRVGLPPRAPANVAAGGGPLTWGALNRAGPPAQAVAGLVERARLLLHVAQFAHTRHAAPAGLPAGGAALQRCWRRDVRGNTRCARSGGNRECWGRAIGAGTSPHGVDSRQQHCSASALERNARPSLLADAKLLEDHAE
jgi:hypothetical protein